MEDKGWILLTQVRKLVLMHRWLKRYKEEITGLVLLGANSSIGKFNMQLVPFGVPFAGAENWDGCIAKAEQDLC